MAAWVNRPHDPYERFIIHRLVDIIERMARLEGLS